MKAPNPVIAQTFEAHQAALNAVRELECEIDAAASVIIESMQAGGLLLLAGNGGSAGDAQHIAGEFVGRFLRERRALPAMALNTNSTIITAIGNDYGFENIFSRQVEAHGKPGDVLIAISTSGNSGNVIKAAQVSRAIGMKVIGMTGRSGGDLLPLCDICLAIPSDETPRVQEMHILIGHILCDISEGVLAG